MELVLASSHVCQGTFVQPDRLHHSALTNVQLDIFVRPAHPATVVLVHAMQGSFVQQVRHVLSSKRALVEVIAHPTVQVAKKFLAVSVKFAIRRA
jgi:hypothetical protein